VRVRITLAFAVAMAIVLLAGAWVLYTREESALTSSVDDNLQSRSEVVMGYLTPAGRGLGRVPIRVLDPDEDFAQVLDGTGRTLDSSAGFERRPVVDPAAAAAGRDTEYLTRSVPGLGAARVAVVPIDRAGPARYLVVGTSTSDIDDALGELLGILLIAMPVGLVATTAMGWRLAGRALRPVELMRKDAERISEHDLGRRLPVPPTGDELARLASTMNRMLDRVERAVSHERRLVDLASHELRSPLGVARAEVDLALGRRRSREELERALRIVAEELDWMSRLADDLLVLARTEQGRVPLRPTKTSLNDIAAHCVSRYRDRADAERIDLRVQTTDHLVLVDVDRMHQAVSNMVDNALRHSVRDGWVAIRAQASESAVRIAVEDSGDGFPEDILDRVFEPFATSNHERGFGTGLGLTIVLAVAQSHGGTAVAENLEGGGARVTVVLPPDVAVAH
jgi:signal transduction histidine kinase